MAELSIQTTSAGLSGAVHGAAPYGGPLLSVAVGTTGITSDLVHGGRVSIVGTTKIKATPANLPTLARVRLLREVDAMPLRETWSNPVTGAFRFDDLSEKAGQYIALAQDPTGNYQAVAADRITAEVDT